MIVRYFYTHINTNVGVKREQHQKNNKQSQQLQALTNDLDINEHLHNIKSTQNINTQHTYLCQKITNTHI